MRAAAVLCLVCATSTGARAAPGFEAFDARAKAGERLNVVFFGASLTWGANASDPQHTSYRARVEQKLNELYPKAHFECRDAAIGGTGSQLGVFRFERDVLRHKPDLVFLDFSANDDIGSADPETCASYEALVRRIILDARAPVVIVIFPFLWNVAAGTTDGMAGRDAHLRIAQAYHVPVGDAIALGQRLVREKRIAIKEIWPFDGVHPGDAGYAMFADAAWDAFTDAVSRKVVCAAPEKMLHDATYMTRARVRISSLGKLPAGWRVDSPSRTSAWYDALMTRWLDDVVVASNRATAAGANGKKQKAPQQVERLKVTFNASMVMFFGEETLSSGRYRVYIDGKPVEHKPWGARKLSTEFDASAKRFGGTRQHAQVIAQGLTADTDHTLEIEPLLAEDEEQELRLESICVAGGPAEVRPLRP